jgi:cytosine/adenosine deaminase-related metal-dependent hydrolase
VRSRAHSGPMVLVGKPGSYPPFFRYLPSGPFRAATINNAREFKLDSQIGTIEPGKIANLILLKKSPLESVDAYDSIITVWVHGKPISRDSLAAYSSK